MTEQEILNILRESGVPYSYHSHAAVHTMAESEQVFNPQDGVKVKNLFLRNKKKTAWYLITTAAKDKIDIKTIQKQLNESKLSFGSAEDMQQYLQVLPGFASPLNLLSPTAREIAWVLDSALTDTTYIYIHPNNNAASIRIQVSVLKGLLSQHTITLQ